MKKTKSKETVARLVGTNIEIFSLRAKLVPCDTLELKDTTVAQFAWEPTGNKVGCGIVGLASVLCV